MFLDPYLTYFEPEPLPPEGETASQPPLVSVLACLSAAAPAVKELLVSRLESPLEDIRVKVAILELVAACVDQQPGLTQLLLDIQPGGEPLTGPGMCQSLGKHTVGFL